MSSKGHAASSSRGASASGQAMANAAATSTTDLSSLASASNAPPAQDALVSVLQSRSRLDLPYTHIGQTTVVAVNPLRTLANVNERSAKEYAEKGYAPQSGDEGAQAQAQAAEELQPHPYELAARTYLTMRKTGRCQTVVYTGVTGSGKTSLSRLYTSQLLRLSSTRTKKALRLSSQILALDALLVSFGTCKTILNSTASRFSRLLELHFLPDSEGAHLAGAKVLAWGLERDRSARLRNDERSFNVFYQLLAGATPQERESLELLDDPAEYVVLASSGCLRLPGGPGSDDSVAMDDLRESFKLLGFKQKHITAIFKMLSAILLLGNLQFADRGEQDTSYESAWVSNRPVLESAARLMGVEPEELEKVLTDRTTYIRSEICTVLLKADGAAQQRDIFMMALYRILFAYVLETANHRLYPGDEALASLRQAGGSTIYQLDIPGFQTRSATPKPGARMSTLVQAHGHDGYSEFLINYAHELVQCWLAGRALQPDGSPDSANQEADAVPLPTPSSPSFDWSPLLELTRGGSLAGRADSRPGGIIGGLAKIGSTVRKGRTTLETADAEFAEGMRGRFASHPAFVASPPQSAGASPYVFGVRHHSQTVTYDAKAFVEQDLDAVDPDFVSLLRSSAEPFVAKLLSGPSLAGETHPMDEKALVAAQVSSMPLRAPTASLRGEAGADGVPAALAEVKPLLDPSSVLPTSAQTNASLSLVLDILGHTKVWTCICIRPNEASQSSVFNGPIVRQQLQAAEISALAVRRRQEYIEGIPLDRFVSRFCDSIPGDDESMRRTVQIFASERGWTSPSDYAIGDHSVWLGWKAWKAVIDSTRGEEQDEAAEVSASIKPIGGLAGTGSRVTLATLGYDDEAGYAFGGGQNDSVDDLLERAAPPGQGGAGMPIAGEYGYAGVPSATSPLSSVAPAYAGGRTRESQPYEDGRNDAASDVWGSVLPREREAKDGYLSKEGGIESASMLHSNSKGGGEKDSKARAVEEVESTRARRIWVMIVMMMTFLIPSWFLKTCGRMKRPDIQMAWREKLAICMLIFFACAFIIFYIVAFGRIICPEFDKVWNVNQVGAHTGENDFWVSLHGDVYDISKFWKGDHSNVPGAPVTKDAMQALAGQELTPYFPIPLTLGCPGLVNDQSLALQSANFTPEGFVHTSGAQSPFPASDLANVNWYTDTFLPVMREFRKGPLVWGKKEISKQVNDGTRSWATYKNGLYDLTDYFYTIEQRAGVNGFIFLPAAITDLFKQQPGADLTSAINKISPAELSSSDKETALICMRNVFYLGEKDVRETPRCEVQGYLLLAFTIILGATILAKFLAALQLGSKNNPEPQDKFVICQVPCYTEGEESLKKTIDSLAVLQYDDKRKLMFIICDGMIIGSGNDRPTPRIVLDILGVDPSIDPEPLLFKSVGEGSAQLNYGKVYSGLYECEGHLVPYLVVVKVGKPSERSRPGNRGKRDSQILLMRFLNRVHFDAEMCPLELEICHQVKNVIGVDPSLFEYLLCVDADTEVAPDSLNRLIASVADDSRIVGICGETRLSNEQESWWTMIQVYEYYISHHLSKAFESLFGSVTCLPGCFCLYRLRTNDKGRPLIVSNLVIDDYAEGNVDTLHKKNLFSLGEDRYLTTLILKHFPTFKTKFIPDARAFTSAPSRWGILLSQRRRWINSTIHNLVELTTLKDMCGFCCFSMRFIVLVDLLGTIILPATTVYLVYLIVVVATGSSSLPTISIIVLAAVYGLQAVIFLLKRQWQFIGWLVIYLLAYPIYSFFLPIYSFWHMDDFSWGSTRVVVGEGKNKKILANPTDEPFSDDMIPLRKFSEYQQMLWEAGTQPSHVGGQHSRAASSVGGFSQARGYGLKSGRSFDERSVLGGGYDPNSMGQSPYGQHSRGPSRAMTANPYSTPQFLPPILPYPTGHRSSAPSVAGSDRSGARAAPAHTRLNSSMSLGATAMLNAPGFGAMSQSGSVYDFGGNGTAPPSVFGYNMGAGGRQSTMSFMTQTPLSTLAPTVNLTTSPTDAELTEAIRRYLSTQDLMQVTKRTAREAVQGLFPNADLSSKKGFLNQTIDAILQGGAA